MSSHFTSHGFRRVNDHTALTHSEVSDILSSGKAILLGGEEKNPDRLHWVFYSIPDADCFVVVRDRRNAEIITLLPIHYHENIAWNISLDTLKAAELLMVGEKRVPDDSDNLSSLESAAIGSGERSESQRQTMPPSRLKLYGILRSPEGEIRRVNLGSVSLEEYLADPNGWKIDEESLGGFKQKVEDRGFNGNQLVAIVAKMGRSGTEFVVSHLNRAG